MNRQNQSAAYTRATQWLNDRIDYERLGKSGVNYRFTLDRMRELIRRLGHGNRLAISPDTVISSDAQSVVAETSEPGRPHDAPASKPRIIHIAGTKGKGSVATMIATMLTAGGFRVGLYTSPHLVRLEERFRVDGEPASQEQMVDLIESVQPIVDAMASEAIGGPSFFELTTALAIEHFHRCGCDHWVLETGLGGRLDSTNVFQSDVTVITSIGLDHQHVLGDTVDKIAKEKAGIFKRHVPAISGVREPLSGDVIRQVATKVQAPLKEIDHDFQIVARNDAETDSLGWGSQFSLVGLPSPAQLPGAKPTETNELNVHLGMEGDHQNRNAALAIIAVRTLDLTINHEMLSELSKLQIEARLEKIELSNGVTVVLDSAHNPDSISALVQTIQSRFPNRRVIGVFGTSVDKDAGVMLGQLKACFADVVLTRYRRNPRFVPTAELHRLAQPDRLSDDGTRFGVNEHPQHATEEAIELASSNTASKGVVVICGSFFLAAEVRPWLMSLPQDRSGDHNGS